MSNITQPPDLAPGNTALAAHVTPLYGFLNAKNIDRTNMPDNGVDAVVLKDATLDTHAKTFPKNIQGADIADHTLGPSLILAATVGSVTLAYGGGDVTVTHNKGQAPILGCDADFNSNNAGLGRMVGLKSVSANTFSIGEKSTMVFLSVTPLTARSANVFYDYF